MQRFRAWIAASAARRWTAATLGLAALVLGVTLTVRAFVRPTPPDPATASTEQIIDFLASGKFDRVSPSQRDRLLSETAWRYMNMTAAQRRDFEQEWRDSALDRELQRKIEAQMDFALACRMAEEFVALSPEQQGPFLDRMLFMIHAMGGGTKFLQWLDSNPALTIARDPASQTTLGSFERQLIHGTTAEQRASMFKLGGALVERSRGRRP